jgi:hypothetical protein
LEQGSWPARARLFELQALAEVRHRAAEFCDFDVEIRGSLVFTTWVSEKVM